MAAPSYADPPSLAVLTDSLHQTLVETGRFFRDKASLKSRQQLQRTVPVAHEQFASALDDLSEHIFLAKAFLERDYEAVLAKKAALKPVEAVAKTSESPVKSETAAPQPPPSQPTPGEEPPQKQPDEQPATTHAEPAPSAVPDPVVSGAGDFGFDSGLPGAGGGDNGIDLNLDFGDDGVGNENFLSGAEASLPAGGDAFDRELQNLGGDGEEGEGGDELAGHGESTFDDLFLGEEMGGGDGLMNLNEIDDNWFS